MHPIAFQASLHQWQLFVTLTYESRDECGNALKVPDERGRRGMLFAYLRRCGLTKRSKEAVKVPDKRMSLKQWKALKDQGRAHVERVPFAFLKWLAREERGEAGGRYHYHILLDGFPPSRMNPSELLAQKALWREIGGGFMDIRAFQTHLNGVKYVMKGLNEWSPNLANAYEVRKFNEDSENRRLILSDSCVRLWAQEGQETRATLGSCDRVITRATPLAGGNPGKRLKRTKETLEELEQRIRSNWLSHHPAGVSFVR